VYIDFVVLLETSHWSIM